jgi:hypothetical protein
MNTSFVLDEEQLRIRERTANFAREHLNQNVAERSRDSVFDLGLWRRCGEESIQGLAVPTVYGGKGYSALNTALSLEGLGYGCEDGGLAFALAAHLLSCTIPMSLYANEDQKEKYLVPMSNGRKIATNAMTEAQGGSAAFQMHSRAESVDTKFVLTGEKSFCANAPVSDLCLTYVLTDREKGFFGGVTAFLLDRKHHKYTISKNIEKLGLRTCQTGSVAFEEIEASSADIIGSLGGGGVIFNKSMDWERVGISAMNVGTMTRILERATRYAKTRKPGGTAISKHQAISHTLANIATEIEACRLLVYNAASQLDDGGNTSMAAAMAKLFVSERFKATTMSLMQLYAAEGFMADSEIGRVLQDSTASTIYSGTSEVQRNIIASWMRC